MAKSLVGNSGIGAAIGYDGDFGDGGDTDDGLADGVVNDHGIVIDRGGGHDVVAGTDIALVYVPGPDIDVGHGGDDDLADDFGFGDSMATAVSMVLAMTMIVILAMI